MDGYFGAAPAAPRAVPAPLVAAAPAGRRPGRAGSRCRPAAPLVPSRPPRCPRSPRSGRSACSPRRRRRSSRPGRSPTPLSPVVAPAAGRAERRRGRARVRVGGEDTSQDSQLPGRPARHGARPGLLGPAPDRRRAARRCAGTAGWCRWTTPGTLSPQSVQKTLYAILTQKQREKFEENLELDFAYSLPGQARFRVNLYRQRDALGAAFRLIPYEIKPLEELGVPPAVRATSPRCRAASCSSPGPTGSGKSTTLACGRRPGQPHPARPHHDRRGPDRVPPRAQELPGQPARGGGGHLVVQERAQARAAPGPRHHPGR